MKKESNYCAFPRFHLQIKPNGKVKPCCRFDLKTARGLYSGPASLDLLNSSGWESLRAEMDQNSSHEGCYKCAREESLGQNSMRISVADAQKKWGIDSREIGLQDLEIGFGNLCNLACRSCGSALSSRWYEDDVFLRENFSSKRSLSKKQVVELDLDFSNSSAALANIKNIKFTGGEPLLHKNFWKFLTQLIEEDRHSQVHLRICTNATVIPTPEQCEILQKFSSVDMSLSIDAVGKQNEYLRYPSKWTRVEKVVGFWMRRFQQQQQWHFTLCATISALSLEGFDDLMLWWTDLNDQWPNLKFSHIAQPAFSPEYLSPLILPTPIVDALKSDGNQSILGYFNGSLYSEDLLRQFRQFNTLLDLKREQNAKLIFPKLYSLLEEVL